MGVSGHTTVYSHSRTNMASIWTCSRPGYRSFLKHLKELESAITDPGGLAVELYSNGLIDKVARERASLATVAPLERSRELLQKLENRIESEEAAFDKLLSILARDPTMEDMRTKLRAAQGIRHSFVMRGIS